MIVDKVGAIDFNECDKSIVWGNVTEPVRCYCHPVEICQLCAAKRRKVIGVTWHCKSTTNSKIVQFHYHALR